MPIVTMKELLARAEKGRYAVGAFNVANMEMAVGAIQAAEELSSPAILQIAEVRLPHSPLSLIGPLMVAAARAAKVPVAVNFDHGVTLPKIHEALEIGFTSVMIDGSRYPMEENVRITNKVREMASRYGASVEAEIGAINPGGENVEYTDPAEAEKFYSAVRVDALAVAIGNAHGLYRGEPHLNFEVLREIDRRVPAPLVLHGGTGIGEADFRKCVECGVRKVNVATATFNAVEDRVRRMYREEDAVAYFTLQDTEILGARENVRRHILMFGSAGKAEILKENAVG